MGQARETALTLGIAGRDEREIASQFIERQTITPKTGLPT
jgi:hypothetical protein